MIKCVGCISLQAQHSAARLMMHAPRSRTGSDAKSALFSLVHCASGSRSRAADSFPFDRARERLQANV